MLYHIKHFHRLQISSSAYEELFGKGRYYFTSHSSKVFNLDQLLDSFFPIENVMLKTMCLVRFNTVRESY